MLEIYIFNKKVVAISWPFVYNVFCWVPLAYL